MLEDNISTLYAIEVHAVDTANLLGAYFSSRIIP